MNGYEDSFEADTTSTDEEEEAMSVHSASTSSNSNNNAGEAGSNADGSDTIEDEVESSASRSNKRSIISSSQPSVATPVSASPVVVVAPGLGPIPMPVPVPVAVAKSATSTASSSTSVANETSLSVTSSPAVPAAPATRGRAGGLTSPIEVDDVDSEDARRRERESANDATALYEPAVHSVSNMSHSDSTAGVLREMKEAAREAADGSEFRALETFKAFGSSRPSEATTTAAASPRPSEDMQVPPAPSTLFAAEAPAPAPKAATAAAEPVLSVPVPAPSARTSTSNEGASGVSGKSVEVPPQETAAVADESPQKTSSESKAGSVAPSSVFSTLSQHLQLQPQPTLPQPTVPTLRSGSALSLPSLPVPALPTLAITTAPSALPALPPPPTPLAARDLFGSGTAPVLAGASVTGAIPRPSAPPAASPSAGLALPSLPPPSWATAATPSPAAAATAGNGAAAAAAAPSQTVRGSGWMIGDVTYRTSPREHPVAPLPPPPESAYYRPPTAEETRASELREASEAVERLVKAFAVLKGYGALDQQATAAKTTAAAAASKVSESAATTTAHRSGAASTMRVRQVSRPLGPRVPSQFASASPAAASPRASAPASAASSTAGVKDLKAREQLAEGLVLDCVLGLLQEHAKQGGKGGGEDAAADASSFAWRAARPHYEVVSADSFAYGASRAPAAPSARVAGAPHVYANPTALGSGVPGIDVPLFDPRDRQSAADLYRVAQDAIGKYVLRRVRTGGAGPTLSAMAAGTDGSTPVTSPLRITRITAAFAWTLLLDMASVCEEIARAAYDAASTSPSAVYPVLVQFRGDAVCEEVARAAMHCLPFEALYTNEGNNGGNATSASESGGCQFRMACWVTKEHLWTLADALLDTVREDMVKRAQQSQYSLFHSEAATADVDPRLLVPSRAPLFTMRPLPNRRTTLSAAAPTVEDSGGGAQQQQQQQPLYRSSTRAAPEASAAARDLFDVPPAGLQKVAYHISSLSTSILSTASPDGIVTAVAAEDYPDVAMAVSETLSELLQDESIKAAVQRRAAEKVKKALAEKVHYVSASRQRKEQAIIAKAEKEAEEVVQHILQEMRAQGVA